MRSVIGALVALALVTEAGAAAAATLYGTNTRSDSISVIDTETFEVLDTIPLGRGKANRIAVHPDARTAWVNLEVSTWPAHAVFSPDGTRLYVSGETAGDLTVIDVASRAIVKIDTATHQPVGAIAPPGIVHEATLTLDGKYLYATLRRANRVVVVRTADDRIVASIPQKAWPDLVLMEPGGRHAFVTNRYADLVAVIDVTTHKQAHAIPVGKAPHGMALRPR